MVKIRLARRGRKKSPFFHILVADERARRDGRFIEKIGYYNPILKTENRGDKVVISLDRYKYWIGVGAQPTETIKKLISLK